MYCTRKVNDDYTWVGADCRRLALFEGVFGVPEGVSYNSYLLLDEKTEMNVERGETAFIRLYNDFSGGVSK